MLERACISHSAVHLRESSAGDWQLLLSACMTHTHEQDQCSPEGSAVDLMQGCNIIRSSA